MGKSQRELSLRGAPMNRGDEAIPKSEIASPFDKLGARNDSGSGSGQTPSLASRFLEGKRTMPGPGRNVMAFRHCEESR